MGSRAELICRNGTSTSNVFLDKVGGALVGGAGCSTSNINFGAKKSTWQ